MRVLKEGKGNSKAISRSNNKKSIATRKNRKEKGTRADFRGSNPHSYGEAFSYFIFRRGRKCAAKDIMATIVSITARIIVSLKILLIYRL